MLGYFLGGGKELVRYFIEKVKVIFKLSFEEWVGVVW